MVETAERERERKEEEERKHGARSKGGNDIDDAIKTKNEREKRKTDKLQRETKDTREMHGEKHACRGRKKKKKEINVCRILATATTTLAMTYPFCIDFLPSWIVDGRSSRVDPWLVDRASSRPSPGIRFSTLLAALGTSRTSGPPIATRDPPDPSDRPRSPRIRAYRFVSYRPAASDRSRALSQPDIVSVWKIA